MIIAEKEAELAAFNERVKSISIDIQLEGMDPSIADQKARQMVVQERKVRSLKLADAVLKYMAVTTKRLEGGYQWMMLDWVMIGVNKENPGLNSTQNEVLELLGKYSDERILNYRVFDHTKPKWQYIDPNAKPPEPQPGSSKDLADW
jgi:hypothetical protein